VERTITEKENGDFPYTNEDAMGNIYEMDQELSMHLIRMFHIRLGTSNGKGKGFDPFATDFQDRYDMSEFMWSILSTAQTYGKH
jgi:hypothetical protein